MRAVSKSSLSPRRRCLVELMHNIGFGRIEALTVANGEPVLEPPPRIVREVKFGGDNGPRPNVTTADFLLKQQVIDLFKHFDELGDGIIDVLEIKHGLPFRVFVVGEAASWASPR